MSFSVKTTAFSDGAAIPKKYTCDGPDVSPALEWSGAPAGTKSLALIADDPDAPVGTWTHWIAWNISPDRSLPEGLHQSGCRARCLRARPRRGDGQVRKITPLVRGASLAQGYAVWTYIVAVVYAVAGILLLIGKKTHAAATAIGLAVVVALSTCRSRWWIMQSFLD